MKPTRTALILSALLFATGAQAQGKYLGDLNGSRYDPNSVNNPYGQYGSKYSPDSINNPYGQYGSRYSNDSPNNPYATNPPKVYDQSGNYLGDYTANPYNSNRYRRR